MPQKRPKDPYTRFAGMMALLYAQGHTNADIAKMLGVHERTIYKWGSKQRRVGPLLLGALERVVTKPSA